MHSLRWSARWSIATLGVLGLATLLVLPASARADSDAIVEGYVFSKNTGVPLRGAAVWWDGSVSFGPPPARSDGNGFFSFRVPIEIGQTYIRAECRTTRGVLVAPLSPLELREGTIQRNLYIDVGWNRIFSSCIIPDVVY